MTVCVLLAVLLGGGTGAPLARAAPAPGRVLHQMIADRLGGVPATPAASAAPERPPPAGDSREPRQYGETGDYDYYYVYEYDDLPPDDTDVSTAEVGQAAAVAPTESSAAATDAAPSRASQSPTPEEQAVSSVTGHSEVNEIDLEHQAAGGFQQSTAPFEQQGSSSDKVLAYQLRAANLDEPRETPEFFVPPIVRRPYRRRVSLTGGGRRSNAPSLGDRLAEQVRRQLEELERREQAETGYRHPFIPSPPTTSERPYRHPFIPSPPTTTEKPYKHPFIPTPPSTTEKPYKPPFIPTPPSTTEKPYRPPFIPTAPSTTSRPYQHPFIPSAPTPSPQPYRHPFIPVPPSATERPQARRIGGDASRAQATIVHEETLEAGFIVGEYGVVHGGGTVRGVKYAADSSVDRRLLEEALAHFLRL
ncbi:hypothetical protein FJT64_012325 [Amphibalanus amphitrite]|uniref:Uncharacterized protein n=1 Tax=Amphibalanus amphitrite TaxID=1232801 RepID=A0A6A4V6S4_AMPAM|nr:hypothetical protein FJT64_012325 [Amphibalanus amphitrite]